jgi:hypothetical protein
METRVISMGNQKWDREQSLSVIKCVLYVPTLFMSQWHVIYLGKQPNHPDADDQPFMFIDTGLEPPHPDPIFYIMCPAAMCFVTAMIVLSSKISLNLEKQSGLFVPDDFKVPSLIHNNNRVTLFQCPAIYPGVRKSTIRVNHGIK